MLLMLNQPDEFEEEYPRRKNTNLLKPVLKGQKKNNVLSLWIKNLRKTSSIEK